VRSTNGEVQTTPYPSRLTPHPSRLTKNLLPVLHFLELGLDHVAVHDADAPHARRDEVLQHRNAEAARAMLAVPGFSVL
jgi:hypothetical protein